MNSIWYSFRGSLVFVSCITLLASAGVFPAAGVRACEEGCVATYEKCGGREIEHALACCDPNSQCVTNGTHFAQCRPKSDDSPRWSSATALACGAPVDPSTASDDQGRTKRPRPDAATNSSASAPVSADASDAGDLEWPISAASAPAMSNERTVPTVAEDCGGVFLHAASTACTKDCRVASNITTATSEAECLDACSIHGHCHCAIFDGASGACDMFWTPCDSAMLNVEHSADNPLVTALQPCMELPLEVQHSTQVQSQYARCKPMEQYDGTVVLHHACQAPTCVIKAIQPASVDIDDCIESCLDVGYEMCKAVQFRPQGSFGLEENECLMFSTRIQDMGVHATAQILAYDGLGAIVASFCSHQQPEEFRLFPASQEPFGGVDWAVTCENEAVEVVAGQSAVVFVPHLQLGCETCVFIPEHRTDQVPEAGSHDTLHYRSQSIQECAKDCIQSEECGCAFFRVEEDPEPSVAGWCALTTAECSDPVAGAQADHTRTRTAISKCGYTASAETKSTYPTVPYDGVDWHGVWEDVCLYPDPFTYTSKNSVCGPNCVARGTYTSLEPDTEACSKRCESMHSCACSYYQPGSRFCTLMAGDVNAGMEAIAPACRPWDFLEGAMALEKDAALSNHVSVVCAREDLDVSSGSTPSLGFAETAFTA